MYKKKEKKLIYEEKNASNDMLNIYIYIIGLINGFNTDTKLNCTEIHNTTFLFSNKSFVLNNTNTQKIRKIIYLIILFLFSKF